MEKLIYDLISGVVSVNVYGSHVCVVTKNVFTSFNSLNKLKESFTKNGHNVKDIEVSPLYMNPKNLVYTIYLND